MSFEYFSKQFCLTPSTDSAKSTKLMQDVLEALRVEEQLSELRKQKIALLEDQIKRQRAHIDNLEATLWPKK